MAPMTWQRSRVPLTVAVVAMLAIAVLMLPSSNPPVRSGASAPPDPGGSDAPVLAPPTSAPSTTLEVPSEAPEALPPVEVPSELVAEPAPVTSVPAGPIELMLIGDSMAFTAALGLSPHAGTWGFTVANEGINGCGVVRGGPYRYFGAQRQMEPRCEAWPAAWQDALARNTPDLVGIVVGRWELMDRMYDGRWTNLFDPAFAAYVESEVDAAITLAQSGGARVVVFTSPYYRRGTKPDGGLFPEDDPARVDVVNALLRRVAERRGVPVIDVGARLSPEGRYTRDVDGIRVRSDGVHLTRQTGDILAPWLFPQLQQLMAAPPPAPVVPVP